MADSQDISGTLRESRRGKAGVVSSDVLTVAVLLVIVSAAAIAAHWSALEAKAICLDDFQYLVENPLVRNPSWGSVKRFLTEVFKPSTVRGYYQPLTMISLMVDYAMGGRQNNLVPFHITSLCLHVVNTSLVIVLLYMLFGQIWPAAMVGLLFAVHPMTVEPIPWVGERKTLLASFFALWCMIIYVRYTRKSNWKLFLGCAVMYVLALMAKPTTTPVPVLLLLLDFWPLRRLSRKVLLEKVPLFIIMAVFGLITVISQSRSASIHMPTEEGPMRIPLILCHNIIFYLYKAVWPVNLSSHYPFPKPLAVSDPMILAGVIGTCVLLPVLLISLRWTRALVTGWAFFFIAIFPTMGVVGFTNVIASDKYAYLPSVGLLMVLAWLLGRLWSRVCGPLVRRIILVVFVLALVVSESITTRRYLQNWQDSETYYRRMLKLAPDSAVLHHNFGNALGRIGKLDEAIEHHSKAVSLRPRWPSGHYNLGLTLASRGKMDEAVGRFIEAIRLKPEYAKAHGNLGVVLFRQGKLDQAIERFNKALQLDAGAVEANYNLGLVFAEQGRIDEAVAQLRKTLLLRPEDANIHYALAAVLTRKGLIDEAISELRQTLRINPNHKKAYQRLQAALAIQETR